MYKLSITLAFCLILSICKAQDNHQKEIERIQLKKLSDGICLDFIRNSDLKDFEESSIQQIFIFRHGEPAMNKKGWKNRKEAIRYIEMYDSVGVYDFAQKPICLREKDINIVYTSKLPRAINTAEKTFNQSMPLESHALFNEFERKIIQFPNIKLPRQFWSVTTRIVWMMGFNKKGIESFSQAKDRSRRAAFFLNDKAENDASLPCLAGRRAARQGKVILFSHGFMNKYIKRYLKKEGYKAVNLNGQKYLGAYYFYRIK
ncbi:MAG: histidine phosphatase family protein [Cyclobacteriaceae bacterium]|nr:histidine phosphatase family protein [Cyclobacteriaceae bacterium]